MAKISQCLTELSASDTIMARYYHFTSLVFSQMVLLFFLFLYENVEGTH